MKPRSPNRPTLSRSLAVACIAALAGCASMAPDYERPAAPVPAQWPQGPAYPAAATASGADSPAAELAWEDFFRDERLRQVIARALDESRPLRQAMAAVEKARAQYDVQRAAQWPTVDAGVGGNAARSLAGTAPDGKNLTAVNRSWQASVGVSAWEIDLFGKTRSLSDAALESYLATAEGERAVRLTLVADTATAWLALAADRSRLETAGATLDSALETLTLARRRLDVGVATRADVSDAELVYQQARSDVARYTAAVAQDRNALELLVGAPVDESLLPPVLAADSTWLAPVPVGLSSTVLLARPDVLQAEHQLKAANADIGAARAAFFPSITLTTAGGIASAALSSLFTGGAWVWSFIPAITVPIFDGGANAGNLAAAQAQQKSDLAAYELAIQTAFAEVANALATRGTIGEQLAAQEALVAAADNSFTIAQARFVKGVDSYLAALIAQRALYSSQQELVTTRFTALQADVTLYRALGGGTASEAQRAAALAPATRTN